MTFINGKGSGSMKKMVMTALMAALVCITTMVIRIPIPSTGGYIHPGDAMVILSGVLLGPGAGFMAAGIGSAFADLLGGYFVYVPITFAIKGLIGLSSGMLYKKVGIGQGKKHIAVVLGGIMDVMLVAGGYFLCEMWMFGVAGALPAIPANIVQGISGIVISCMLYPIVSGIYEKSSYNKR